MSEKTKIGWTDATWSPIRARVRADAREIALAKGYSSLVQILDRRKADGSPSIIPGVSVGPHCEHVSPGCAHCWSGTSNKRCLPHNGTGLPFDRRSRDLVDIEMDGDILVQPLRWKQPRRIFVENQSDLFGQWVPWHLIECVFDAMQEAHRHTFQVLTKHGENDACLQRFIENWAFHHNGPLANLWLGVSVEDRAHKDRIQLLRKTPAALRFLSLEPLLEDIGELDPTGIGWVIVGGESGSGARPMHPDWVRSIRDQCRAAGLPFFFKQWGEYCDFDQVPDEIARQLDANGDGLSDLPYRVGTKAAGNLLDGVKHEEFPA